VKEYKESLYQLIRDFTTSKVVSIIKTLLERDIFYSDIKAKIEFLELYLLSPARDVQQAASENNIVRSVVEALDKIALHKEGKDKSEEEVKSAVLPLNKDSTDSI
jgi:hypothetical protein